MSKLILTRHGQSLWNAENRFTGWVDVDLSSRGIDEAKKAGDLIKSLNIQLDVFFTSYLKRAIRTLDIILKQNNKSNVKYFKSWEINERHYGSLTGLNKDEVKKKLGDAQLKKYRRSWNLSPPQMSTESIDQSLFSPLNKNIPKNKIPLTESLMDTYNRVIPYYEKEISKFLKKEKNVLISAHGNSLRALCKYLFNISIDKINELEIPTGNPLIVEFDKNFKIEQFYYLDKEREREIIFNQ
jgi:2,3-bisphosphoglycerate-dependent phosphoglycerate mutase